MMNHEHELLANLVLSGVSNGVFYPKAKDQVRMALIDAWDVDVDFLARTILAAPGWTPSQVPAALLTVLYRRDPVLFSSTMREALTGAEMVRAYAWAARSGISGRKINLSNSVHRRIFQAWFDSTPSEEMVPEGIGPDFGLLDALRCFRVKGNTKAKQALLSKMHRDNYGWTHPFDEERLPPRGVSDPTSAVYGGPYRELVRTGTVSEKDWSDDNIPLLSTSALNRTVVAVDVSFTMNMPVQRHGNVSCLRAASVVGSALAKKNKAKLLAYQNEVLDVELNSGDTVSTNSAKLMSLVKGGTDPAAPLRWLNQRSEEAEVVVILSDDEAYPHDDLLDQWMIFRMRCPSAQLYCIDFAPSVRNRQAHGRVLQMAGFSDRAFEAMRDFARGENAAERIDRFTIRQ